MGLGKSMYPLSANANVLSARISASPRASRGGHAAETESTLALAESGYVDLP